MPLELTLHSTWPEEHEGTIQSICVSQDGRFLASGGSDALLIVWDMTSGAAIHRIDASSAVNIVIWGRNPNVLLYGTENGLLQMLKMEKGSVTISGYEVFAGPVNTLALSNHDDEQYLAIGGNQTVRIWRWTQEKQWYAITSAHSPTHVANKADPSHVVATKWFRGAAASKLAIAYSTDGIVKYDVAKKDVVGAILMPHCGSFDISLNNKLLAVCTRHGAFTLYDSDKGIPLFELANALPPGLSVPVSFCFDDYLLVVGSEDGAIRCWIHEDKSPPHVYKWLQKLLHEGRPLQKGRHIRAICPLVSLDEDGKDELTIYTASSIKRANNRICEFRAMEAAAL